MISQWAVGGRGDRGDRGDRDRGDRDRGDRGDRGDRRGDRGDRDRGDRDRRDRGDRGRDRERDDRDDREDRDESNLAFLLGSIPLQSKQHKTTISYNFRIFICNSDSMSLFALWPLWPRCLPKRMARSPSHQATLVMTPELQKASPEMVEDHGPLMAFPGSHGKTWIKKWRSK